MATQLEQLIGDRYALYGPIAAGGMATVHLGRLMGTAGFSRTVAIKRLHGELVESPEYVSTLLDEARLASRIRHPNVVATMDMVAQDDELFLVMEYVMGESLGRLLTKLSEEGERVEPQTAVGILCGVLHGLHAAHQATDVMGEPLEIVHRDVTPQNVLVGVDGLGRLLDFGIAKGKGRFQTTRAGQLKGKVGYLAPEQILGEEAEPRSDVYSSAVVLWEALVGARLFPSTKGSGEDFSLIPRVLEGKIEPPSAVALGIPSALDDIVMRGLSRKKEERFASARAFALALEDRVGLASNRKIGDWVKSVAMEALAERAEQLAEFEREARVHDEEGLPDLDAMTARRRRRSRPAQPPESESTPLTVPNLGATDPDVDTSGSVPAHDLAAGSPVETARSVPQVAPPAEGPVLRSKRWLWFAVLLAAALLSVGFMVGVRWS